MDRETYIEALRNERGALNNRADTAEKARRIREVEAELDKYADKPAARKRETATKKD